MPKPCLKLIVCTPVLRCTKPPHTRDILWNRDGTRGLHLRGPLVVRITKRKLDGPNGVDSASFAALEFTKGCRGDSQEPRPLTARALQLGELGPDLLKMMVDECGHEPDRCTEKSTRQDSESFSVRAENCTTEYPVDMEPQPKDLLREWMKLHGLTVRGWTKEAGLSSSALQGYVKEGSTAKAMNVDSVAKLARAVRVPLHLLVLYTGGHLPGDPLPPLPPPYRDTDNTDVQLSTIEAIVAGLRRPK